MVKKTGPFQEASGEELYGIYDFLTKITADAGRYHQSNGRDVPLGFENNIRTLESLFSRFMPEVYGPEIKGLNGQVLTKTNGPLQDGKLTQTELASIGPFRAKIQYELNRRGVAQQIEEIQGRRTQWIQKPDPDTAPIAVGAGAAPVGRKDLAREVAAQPNTKRGPDTEPVTGSVHDQAPVELRRLDPLPQESPPAAKAIPQEQTKAQPELYAVKDQSSSVDFAFLPPADPTVPDADAVFSTHVRLMQSFMIQMGHGKHVGEPASGLMNPGTRMVMDAYIKANDLGEPYKDPVMMAVHMHRNLQKGTVKPGIIHDETATLTPATQTMTKDGSIVDQNGQSPNDCFNQAARETCATAADLHRQQTHDTSFRPIPLP